MPAGNTKRYRGSFVPSAIKTLNNTQAICRLPKVFNYLLTQLFCIDMVVFTPYYCVLFIVYCLLSMLMLSVCNVCLHTYSCYLQANLPLGYLTLPVPTGFYSCGTATQHVKSCYFSAFCYKHFYTFFRFPFSDTFQFIQVEFHYLGFLPAICVIMQLHHCTTVPLKSSKVIAVSIHVPHHWKGCKPESHCYISSLPK